eukprot:CAMPEP_0116055962 /NCGR_PEP_ID=MMETSP0322-20121206/3731_1 /TAXON_ID=163516 /ORGANISM="Leptocylindrus danicus var. apora, Strain B651" /LENGTH=228 /DNA_ID=CAMNT_0003539689 /DNA_START=198 /DNA_END=884 /DNA_ORIENTATION=+
MELLVKYTKTHKMISDAKYEEHPVGGTEDKPHMYKVVVGGQTLGYGRGKTRDEAIDHAIRATFFLVQAHGYELEQNEDCLTKEPTVQFQPPPPPPPMPPPPGSVVGGLPPPPPPGVSDVMVQPAVIPQPKSLSSELAVATRSGVGVTQKPVQLIVAAAATSSVGGSLSGVGGAGVGGVGVQGKGSVGSKKSGTDSNLVFQPPSSEDECMEELRAKLPRYSLSMATAIA